MKHRILLSVLLGLSGTFAFAGPQDSVGTKVKNGKIFIMHKVEKAQGLFAISRRYGVPLDELIKHNPGSDEILIVDQIILVPTGRDAPFEEKVVKDYFKGEPQSQETKTTSGQKTTFAKYHTIQKGETLYSISVLYNTQVDVLKNLNNMEGNDIQEGKELLVPSSEAEKNQRIDKIESAQKRADSLDRAIKTVRNTMKTPEQASEQKAQDLGNTRLYQHRVERLAEYDVEKTWERGIAFLYTSNDSKQQRVCSHHNAPIGTTIMVTNPANNKAVFVKVVSHHEMNADKGNAILLSKAAMDYIGLDVGNTVEISFAQ